MKFSLVSLLATFLARHHRGLLLAPLVCGLTLGPQNTRADIIIRTGPPAVITETPGPRPGPHYFWDPGHWRWNGNRYVWVPGHYVARPHPGVRWVPGHWSQRPGGWVWVEGHWR